MTNITEIVIIPSAGNEGGGAFNMGHSSGNMAEVSLVDRYVASIVDELADGGLRHRVVNTRRAPGTALDRRFDSIFDYSLPIVCAVGWNKATKIKQHYNATTIYGHESLPKKLMVELAEVIGHWGSLYVHGHKTATPIVHEAKGIRIEPFCINGPNAIEYAAKMDKLGRDIGRFLVDFCRARRDAAVFSINNQAPSPRRVSS